MAPTQAALGNAVDYAIAPQSESTVPGTDFRSLIVNLPLESGSPVRSEAPDGSVNASGFMTPLIPSTITGAVSVPLRFLTGDILEFAFNLFRKVVKASLQSGAAFQYDYTPDINGPDWALTTYTGINPVQRFFVHGFKVGTITIPLGTGDATTLVATVAGLAQQAQSFGLREPDSGNTGTLDEIFPNEKIDLIKIDVEGHEYGVFSGGRKILSERRIETIVFEEFGGPESPVIKLLSDSGYDIWRMRKDFFGLALVTPEEGMSIPAWEPPNFVASLNKAVIAGLKIRPKWQFFSKTS